MVAQLEARKFSQSAENSSYMVEGLVQVFTSSDRKFFTNVMAQALRIAGQGTPVLIVQFFKGGINQGHEQPVKLGQHLDWIRCDLPGAIPMVANKLLETDESQSSIDQRKKKAVEELWHHTQSVVLEGNYSLIVLDELSLAINTGLIVLNDVLELIKKRPRHLDLVLTGPDMPPAILEVADQITEVRRT
jgi:cob(I)alamin adenosyltransferase